MDSPSPRPKSARSPVARGLSQRPWFVALCVVAGATMCGKAHENERSAAGDVTPLNIYKYTTAGDLSLMARRAKPLVYVPNSLSASVSVIDPATYTVVRTFHSGAVPQHVVPSYDMRRLWVLNNKANTAIPIDPLTGQEGAPVPVTDPYNMYYTPDGAFAVVIAEAERRLDFRDPQTLAPVWSLPAPGCRGIDHMEFTADGRYALATCEFSGQLVKVDLVDRKVVGYLDLADASKMSLSFYGKRPGPGMHLDKLSLQFAMHDTGLAGEVLEAYERLILDAMRGDRTLFTTAEGIERLWELSMPLLEAPPPVRLYPEGSWGPKSIHQLIAPHAWRLPFERAWRDPNKIGS